jgi:signal transduction histidine kinase
MARRSARTPTNHTILVVDDQEETLASVRGLLEREGHCVVTASSGAEALDVLRSHDVHLIILDYFMPRMTGGEVVREVRKFDRDVQIVLQTGYAGEKPPRVMLAELDIQGYHDKADEPERLLLWVDVALKTHRLLKTIRERETLQEELVANCSHELRTPLNIVSGYTELLLDGDFGSLPDPATQPLRSIAEATRDLGHLVTDLLGYAKVSAGDTAASPGTLEVEDLSRELHRFALLLLEDKPVDCTLDFTTAVRTMHVDGAKLRTILRNLITNAAKFTSEGRITIRLRSEGERLAIEVEDTGPGIRAEDQEVIFEPFRQLDGSSRRAHGGLGLGLALSRKLARVLGGELTVRSAMGRGSTFVLTLPTTAVVGTDDHSTVSRPRAERAPLN